MPKLTIDEREIEVAAGTKVIEAAARLGIMIPRFCYHPALGSVGACRVCAVKVLEGPVKGIQMSCMLDAADGMKVSTTDAEAVEFRRYVIEWLMMNHPHDCPVCDEGGHCLLQDMTVSGGHGIRRYPGQEAHLPRPGPGAPGAARDEPLHPLLPLRALLPGVLRLPRPRGARASATAPISAGWRAAVSKAPSAGNLSDICPTGVYTDKPSRFFGRRWDYQRTADRLHPLLASAATR
ncbi:MAG: 2Fe-2S iron-sulfur cluster-binding protein [Desulfobacterales bacterium]|nr:2Fe-2S iron-sulfur cluster-binding protein [Desulfobacterales bacterium]